jgi:hypothetical protein
VLFEPFVSAETSARGAAKLAADALVFLGDHVDGHADQFMMSRMARLSRGIGRALGSLENLELRFGNDVSVHIDSG